MFDKNVNTLDSFLLACYCYHKNLTSLLFYSFNLYLRPWIIILFWILVSIGGFKLLFHWHYWWACVLSLLLLCGHSLLLMLLCVSSWSEVVLSCWYQWIVVHGVVYCCGSLMDSNYDSIYHGYVNERWTGWSKWLTLIRFLPIPYSYPPPELFFLDIDHDEW